MRYAALAGELEVWVEEGLITERQAAAIRQLYADRRGSDGRDRVISMLAVIGAVVGGLGVILFFAANWDAIPRPARVALLLATMVGAYAGGNAARPRRPAVGEGLLLLGALTFGASLFLVGQMYHVQAHDPLAFLVWTAVCVPLALVTRTPPLAALSIITFGAWLAFELVDGTGGDTVLYVPVVGAIYGSVLYAWGTWLRDELFSGPMRGLGFALGTLGAFVLTFRGAIDELGRRDALGTVELVALGGLFAAGAAGAALLALRDRSAVGLAEAAAALAVPALVAASVLVPESGSPIAYPILFNVLVAALALGAIAAGSAREEPWLVNAGIGLVAIDIFARYLDLFWDLLPRALGFLGAGLVLLTLAFALERRRARLAEAQR
jgi:uncharacterized membrane protein